jgi:hypothetical protein
LIPFKTLARIFGRDADRTRLTTVGLRAAVQTPLGQSRLTGTEDAIGGGMVEVTGATTGHRESGRPFRADLKEMITFRSARIAVPWPWRCC